MYAKEIVEIVGLFDYWLKIFSFLVEFQVEFFGSSVKWAFFEQRIGILSCFYTFLKANFSEKVLRIPWFTPRQSSPSDFLGKSLSKLKRYWKSYFKIQKNCIKLHKLRVEFENFLPKNTNLALKVKVEQVRSCTYNGQP